jgi:hypothetical protein
MIKTKSRSAPVLRGLSWGVIAGIIDVIPMLIQKLPVAADLSAFMQWVVVGLFIATIQIGLKGIVKGIFIAVLAIIPVAILIGAQEPMSLIPVVTMTFILGGALGYVLDR